MREDESDFLLSPVARGKQSAQRIQGLGKGVIFNRVVVLVALALLAVFALYSEIQLSDVQLQLESALTRIDHLETVAESHAVVIDRFNSSITNADVLDDLHDLQHNLSKTVKHLNTVLSNTKRDIRAELDETVDSLQTSVAEAKSQISEEVETVKKDMEIYVSNTEYQFSMENSFMIYQLAGTFTVLSCLISMWHMTAHLRKLNQPDVQRKILAILWMSPVYAITSWFSLVFRSAEGYLAIVKDFYEAYTIYTFLSFCISVLGRGDRNVVVDLLAQHVEHLTPPFRLFGCFELCCCGKCCKGPVYESNRHLADAILLQCQLFAMQFVFFRPLITTAMVVMEKFDYYGAGDGPKDYRSPQFYLTIFQNVSVFVAFSGLLKFYHAVDKDLAWCRPFAKFLCIKGVVFMTFWQGLALAVLAQTTDVGGDDADGFAKSSQNFLICLEMLLFSIAHFYCFPTDEWEDDYRVKHTAGSFGDSIAFGDFMSDLKLLIKSNGTGKKGKKKIVAPATIPEGDYENDDETQTDTHSIATSLDTNEELRDDEHDVVAEALRQSLGALSNDPDIAEAKKRLLESKVLSPEFFEYGDSDGLGEMSDAMQAEATRRLEMDDYDNIESMVETGLSGEAGPLNNGTDGSACATESTSLLGSRIGFASPLRPSIFTTVASIAENEDRTTGESDQPQSGHNGSN